MAIIYSYPITTPQDSDLFIISRVPDDPDEISNFSVGVGTIAEYVIDKLIDPNAFDFQIPVFNQSGNRITGSIMSQDSSPSNGVAGTKITIAGNTTTTGDVQIDTLTNDYIPVNNAVGVLRDSVIYQDFYAVSDPRNKAVALNTLKTGIVFGEYPDLRVASRELNDPGVLDLFRPDGDVQAGDRVGILQYTLDDDNQYTVAQIEVKTLGVPSSYNGGGGKLCFKTSTNATGAFPTERLCIDNTEADFSVPINVTNANQSSFAGQVTIPLTPNANTDAASKGYVDSQLDKDLQIQGDTGTGSINLDTQVFDVAGGTYIDTAAGGQTITVDISAVDGNAGINERYLTKNNTWAEIATIPGTYTFDVAADTGTAQTVNTTETLLLAGGTYINTSVGAGPEVTFNHDNTILTTTSSSLSPGVGGSFSVIDSITTNLQGHVTEINTLTVTLPSGGGVGGSGTINTIPIWSTTTDLADSQITQDNTGTDPIFDFNSITGTNQYTPPTNTVLYKLKSGDENKFSITQDGGGGVVLPSGDILNSGPSFNMGGNAFANGENALSVGAATTAFGNGSFAANFLTLASGGGASAFGLLTEATALASAAFGNKSQSTGNYSIAAGQDSIASGQSSVAIGEKGNANGKNSFVQGFGGTAAGNNSAKFGYAGSAGGNNAVKFGFESIASGNASFASGWQTTASGLYSFTAGDGNIASGERAVAFGIDNNVSGKGSFAIGARNTAPSENSFVGGADNTLTGSSGGVPGSQNSFVFGTGNTLDGNKSFVAGQFNQATGSTGTNPQNNLILIGRQNQAVSSNESIAIGESNQNLGSFNATLIGRSNVNTLGTSNYVFGSINTLTECSSSTIIGTANEISAVTGTPNITLLGVGLKYNSNTNTGYGRATYVGYYNDELDPFAQFQIGNGDTFGRKNALSINKQSEIKIPKYGSGYVTGTATYNLAVDASGIIIETPASGAPDYLSFVCLLSQSAATNPQPNIVLENSLGILTPFTAFTRVSSGEYNLNAPGKFKSLKTIVFINNGNSAQTANVTWQVIDADNLRIYTGGQDGALTKASVEIRTYN